VTAVDLSPALLAKARSRRLPADRIHFLEKPFEECDVHGPFDAVIGSSVLHHLDMNRALPKIFALLKPEGCFGFTEPNMLNPQVWVERHFRRLFPYVSPGESAFNRWALKNQMAALGSDFTERSRWTAGNIISYGFTNITIIPFDWLHPAVPQPLIGIARRMGTLLEKLPFIREFAGSLLITARKPPLSWADH
jgi:SAM-dependent methyltransferase